MTMPNGTASMKHIHPLNGKWEQNSEILRLALGEIPRSHTKKGYNYGTTFDSRL